MPEIHRKLDLKTISATLVDELTHLRDFFARAKVWLHDPHACSAFEIAALAHDEALRELALVGLSSAQLTDIARPVRLFDYAALEDQLTRRPLRSVGAVVEARVEGVLHLMECLIADHPLAPVRRVVDEQFRRLRPCAEMLHALSLPRAA
jgi:hypothetical protein